MLYDVGILSVGTKFVFSLINLRLKLSLDLESDFNIFSTYEISQENEFDTAGVQVEGSQGLTDSEDRIFINNVLKNVFHIDNKYNSETLSSGHRNTIFIVLQIIKFAKNNPKEKLLFIDEPENSLHPSYQKKLPELIRMLSDKFPDTQFFISTHSNYLISAALKQNQELGEDLNRVYLLEDGQNTQSDGGPIDFSHFDNALSNLGVQPSEPMG